jgi:RHS repeat-associated protein
MTATPTVTATPTQPPAPIFTNAQFTYDGDGKRVKSVMTTNVGSTTTFFIGVHYEVTGTSITKYYFAGSQRIAMRKNGALYYLLGDHLGSTSIVTDANGVVVSETKYKAWGEVRHQSGVTPTEYGFTGQFSHAADFGLLFYNARWYDVSLGRFAQADTIVPGGIQGLDRYAYVNNSPVNYVDPSGHSYCDSQYAFQEDCSDGNSDILKSQVKIGFGTIKGFNSNGQPEIEALIGGSTLVNDQHTLVTATHVLPGGEKARNDKVPFEFNVPYMFVFDSNGNVHIYSTDGIEVQYADDAAVLVLPFDLSDDYQPATISDDLDAIYEQGGTLTAAYIDGDHRQANNQQTVDVVSLGGPFGNRAVVTNPGGIIGAGDSGGGVFHNGELVGVLSQGNGSPIVLVRGFGITSWDRLFGVQAR